MSDIYWIIPSILFLAWIAYADFRQKHQQEIEALRREIAHTKFLIPPTDEAKAAKAKEQEERESVYAAEKKLGKMEGREYYWLSVWNDVEKYGQPLSLPEGTT